MIGLLSSLSIDRPQISVQVRTVSSLNHDGIVRDLSWMMICCCVPNRRRGAGLNHSQNLQKILLIAGIVSFHILVSFIQGISRVESIKRSVFLLQVIHKLLFTGPATGFQVRQTSKPDPCGLLAPTTRMTPINGKQALDAGIKTDARGEQIQREENRAHRFDRLVLQGQRPNE